ncbi:MAG: hypothetical protein HUJ69_07180 [Lachnospiraceae bacterium]|nr:hypothetical protein [Lachnospiraceae bacterium]
MNVTQNNRGWLANAFTSQKWDSKIKSANTTGKEMWLGYVIGPYGMLLVQSIVNSYYNQYMTDVLGFTAERAAWMAGFMVLFPLLSKLFDAVTNIIMGKELTPAVSTRNVLQRKNLSMAAEITRNIGTGIVSILFPMILSAVCVAMNGNDAQGYLLTMSLMACLTVPLSAIDRDDITPETVRRSACRVLRLMLKAVTPVFTFD